MNAPSRWFLEQPIARVSPVGFAKRVSGQEKAVQPAIVVIVEKHAATADGLENVFLVIATAVDHSALQSRLRCYIHETSVEWQP